MAMLSYDCAMLSKFWREFGALRGGIAGARFGGSFAFVVYAIEKLAGVWRV